MYLGDVSDKEETVRYKICINPKIVTSSITGLYAPQEK